MQRKIILKEKYILYLLWGILTSYGTCSLSYLVNLKFSGIVVSHKILVLPLFILTGFILAAANRNLQTITDSALRNKRIRFSFCFSYLLALSFIMGYQLRMNEMTSHGAKGKLMILILAGGLSVLFSAIVQYWFGLLDAAKNRNKKENCLFTHSINVKIFLICFGAIFLCWIPAFLAYYPAIMSYDFNKQSIEAYQGWIWFNTHHPLVHTSLIRFFLLLGEQLGSYQLAMAVFSLLQMMILSAVYAYSCNMIGRLTGKKWLVVLTATYFALLPIHPVLAMNMTKDILFTAFFLLFALLLLERRMCQKKTARIFLGVALIITGILVVLFRNNAIYALAVFSVFCCIWSNTERIKIALLCVSIVVGGYAVNTSIQNLTGAGSGSKMEIYSVFVQQICRTAICYEAYLSPDELNAVNRYVPYEFWRNYNPTISDPIKSDIAAYSFDNWKDDIPGMLRDWASLGIKYPNEYLDAFLALTSGYWFLDDVSHAEVLGYGDDTNMGLIYTFNASKSSVFEGIENHSFLPGLQKLYAKIINGNNYYNWPVITLLFRPAFYCWALLLCFFSLLYLKEHDKQVLVLLPIIYLLTLLLGPVVNIRYAYPIMVTIPYLLAWVFCNLRWAKASSQKDENLTEMNIHEQRTA